MVANSSSSKGNGKPIDAEPDAEGDPAEESQAEGKGGKAKGKGGKAKGKGGKGKGGKAKGPGKYDDIEECRNQ